MITDEGHLAQELVLDRMDVQVLSGIVADDSKQKMCLNHMKLARNIDLALRALHCEIIKDWTDDSINDIREPTHRAERVSISASKELGYNNKSLEWASRNIGRAPYTEQWVVQNAASRRK